LDLSGSELESVAGCIEYGNEYFCSVKCDEFLDWMSNCYLLKKDSAPWI